MAQALQQQKQLAQLTEAELLDNVFACFDEMDRIERRSPL
jgi:hypothetical protein